MSRGKVEPTLIGITKAIPGKGQQPRGTDFCDNETFEFFHNSHLIFHEFNKIKFSKKLT